MMLKKAKGRLNLTLFDVFSKILVKSAYLVCCNQSKTQSNAIKASEY